MTVEARKLHFIEEFLKVTDENIISQMEHLLRNEKRKQQENSLKPMNMNEFKHIIDKAREDVEQGRVISHENLKQEILSW
ncbi:hypothetical protein [Petrimonas sp.]|uniref:hypothetical protein n=1 Tax=Petrimonas sp. TaxID=2023866 RepID=UPI003F514243